jgi:signal transduction histidine kinase
MEEQGSSAEVLAAVGKMLAKLVRSSALERGDVVSALGELTQTATAALAVDRASVWRLSEDRGRLECLDLYERKTRRHSSGQGISLRVAPQYFRALDGERAVAASNARTDPRTREFSDSYLIPYGIGAMLDAPIWLAGRLVGVVCVEHVGDTREWKPWEELVAGTLADCASMALATADRVRQAVALAEYGSKLEQLVDERTKGLRAAREEAEAANRAKDEFLAILGHELRNPLSPIQTALFLMERLEDTAFEERAVIARQVTHLSRLVDDVLDVSRITRGKIELRVAPVELSEAVAKGIELASPLLERRGHFLEVDVPDIGLEVHGDCDRLAQVVSNLLNNAAKFTPKGGRIQIRGTCTAGHAVLSVRDNGAGIPRELLPRLFEAFVQGERHLDRAQGGLGLGLAIVHGIVVAHEGEVTATSEGNGTGSEFTIRLPLLVENPDEQLADSDLALPARTTRGRRILIVDDNVDAAHMLARALDQCGHQTTTAFDGPTAVALASEFRPQLALLDLGLPVMDGFELATKLKALPGLAGIKLVAVTGYGRPGDVERTKHAGFAEHMVKPIEVFQLETVLESLFDAAP